MKNHYFLTKLVLVSLLLLSVSGIQGQEVKCKLGGRLLMDGIIFVPAQDTLAAQANIVDLRLASKLTYGNWYSKIDIGFAGNKIKVKDAFVQYRSSNHYFRIGYMLGYFGLDQSFSTNDYFFNTGSSIAEALYPGRRNGVSYTLSSSHLYFSSALFLGDQFQSAENLRYGFNANLRIIWRPINNADNRIHLGLSAYYHEPDCPRSSQTGEIRISCSAPTYLKVPDFQKLAIRNVNDQYSLCAEAYAHNSRWMFQGEYMMTSIGSSDIKDGRFLGHGGYLTIGYLLKGRHYGYDPIDAVPTMPSDKRSILLLLRLETSDLNDERNQIFGSYQKTVTIGADYFLNDCVSTRLNYSYVTLDAHSPLSDRKIHLIQGRLQFRF